MCRLLLLICLSSLVLGQENFSIECRDAHNLLRERHRVPELEIDANVQEYAQKHASNLAAINAVKQGDGKYGENHYLSFGSKVSAKSAVDQWYSEIDFYNFDKPDFSAATAHFTQVVWKSSVRLGCAYARGTDGNVYVVAAYDPKGNVPGDFASNVTPRFSNGVTIRINPHIFIISGTFFGFIKMHFYSIK